MDSLHNVCPSYRKSSSSTSASAATTWRRTIAIVVFRLVDGYRLFRRLRLFDSPRRTKAFLLVLLNVLAQTGVFAIAVHQIVDNYYAPVFKQYAPTMPAPTLTSATPRLDLSSHHYRSHARLLGDSSLHHLFFMLHVVAYALAAGLALWIIVHAVGAATRWLVSTTCKQLSYIFAIQSNSNDSTSSTNDPLPPPSPSKAHLFSKPQRDHFLSGYETNDLTTSTTDSGSLLVRRASSNNSNSGSSGTVASMSFSLDPSMVEDGVSLSSSDGELPDHQPSKIAGEGTRRSVLLRLLLAALDNSELCVVILCEVVLFVMCFLESRLLADMSVHFIDLDLVDLIGLKQVLKRQHSLGAGIASEHWKYIHILIMLLFVMQATLYLIARWSYNRFVGCPTSSTVMCDPTTGLALPTVSFPPLFVSGLRMPQGLPSQVDYKRKLKLFYRVFAACLLLTALLFVFTPYQHKLLIERRHHFRSQLPFNIFDKEANKELVPIVARTSLNFPPSAETGYPLLEPIYISDDDDHDTHRSSKHGGRSKKHKHKKHRNDDDDDFDLTEFIDLSDSAADTTHADANLQQQQQQQLKPNVPLIQNRKNIVLIVQESWRMVPEASWAHAPDTNAWARDHGCVVPQIHITPGHVTELGWFSILYGLYPLYYHSYSLGHVPSYPLKVMEENGYVTALFSASLCWSYPNTNMIDNFAEMTEAAHNGELLRSLEPFVAKRAADKKPFLLLLSLHQPEEEYNAVPEFLNAHDGQLARDRYKDRDRIRALQMLNSSGLLEDSLVFLVGDHGDMVGETGEFGHGQKEGSWWNQKARTPLYACMPSQAEAMKRNNNLSPSLTSHVDIVPTIMNFLDLNPPIDPASYSAGLGLIRPKDEDVPADRAVVCTARYFPRKNKINAFITRENKWWFRVNDYNHHTGNMTVAMELHTNSDDELSQCDLEAANIRLASDASSTLTVGTGRTAYDQEKELETDPCLTDTFQHLADQFQHDFWRFAKPA
eukprot:TRINITY_DN1841_c0_g2_i1.p1 TRINITY_DN1841_c0_g2~~TRINITY_DN1841_c0_g2_i1.p1  ORF type:complete len:995 (+),score=123.56 TRINITY_DN1841_c0_g2_i1:220-3204(+)